MSLSESPITLIAPDRLHELTAQVNAALKSYSDKDWNYSRISLQVKRLVDCDGTYTLWFEVCDTRSKQGKLNLKAVSDEVAWGDRHSNELGILEVISLRINKAIHEAASDAIWEGKQPIVRLVKKQALEQLFVTHALWYVVHEVSGEDFDNR